MRSSGARLALRQRARGGGACCVALHPCPTGILVSAPRGCAARRACTRCARRAARRQPTPASRARPRGFVQPRARWRALSRGTAHIANEAPRLTATTSFGHAWSAFLARPTRGTWPHGCHAARSTAALPPRRACAAPAPAGEGMGRSGNISRFLTLPLRAAPPLFVATGAPGYARHDALYEPRRRAAAAPRHTRALSRCAPAATRLCTPAHY
jgi:hypothetical protein